MKSSEKPALSYRGHFVPASDQLQELVADGGDALLDEAVDGALGEAELLGDGRVEAAQVFRAGHGHSPCTISWSRKRLRSRQSGMWTVIAA